MSIKIIKTSWSYHDIPLVHFFINGWGITGLSPLGNSFTTLEAHFSLGTSWRSCLGSSQYFSLGTGSIESQCHWLVPLGNKVHGVGDQHPVRVLYHDAYCNGCWRASRCPHCTRFSAEVTSGQSSHVSIYVLPGAPRRIHVTQYSGPPLLSPAGLC